MFIQKNSIQRFKGFLSILFISMLLSGVAHATTVQSVTGQLKLLATIDNRPAFSSVVWKISLNIAGATKLVKTIKQHSASIDLPPGTYQVVLSSKNQAETHYITIVERTPYNLTINLGK